MYYLINVRNLNLIMIIIYVDLGPTNVDANGHVIVENDVNLAYFEPLSLWPHPWPQTWLSLCGWYWSETSNGAKRSVQISIKEYTCCFSKHYPYLDFGILTYFRFFFFSVSSSVCNWWDCLINEGLSIKLYC